MLLNEQLIKSFSPLQLVLLTVLITLIILRIYRFLFDYDEGIFLFYLN